MKKIVSILLCFFVLSINPIFANEVVTINFDLPTDENIEKQLQEIMPLLEEAHRDNDIDKYYKVATKGYNLKKTGNPQNIKIYNDILSASAIEYSLQNYDLTKEKKYLKRAYKWSKIAVKDRTNQIYSIQAAIILAGAHLNLKNMTKAYKLYMAVDPQGAENFYNDYQSAYNSTKGMIKDRSAKRKRIWANVLYSLGTGISAGANGYSNALRNQTNTYSAPRSTNTTCRTIGNTLYCNSY